MIASSVGRVEVGSRHRGTAFVVSPDLLVTCAHCVPGTRGARATVAFASGERVPVVVVDPRPEVDLALLAVDLDAALPATAVPLALGHPGDARRGRHVDAPGWPLDNPSTTTPQILTGTIDQPRAWFRAGVEAVRVASPQVAAGARPRGSSGSPVVVRGPAGPLVVGVLTWMQEDDDPERAIGGVVYATPVDVVTAVWGHLSVPFDGATTLAGGRDLPAAAAIRRVVTSRIEGPGGALPFAGRDEVLARLDRWARDPEAPEHHVIGGPAGIGKSTTVVRWALGALDHSDLSVVLVPVSASAELTGLGPVVRALAHRLAHLHDEQVDRAADAAELADAVRTYLERPAPAGTRVVVVLDALDEAVGWEPRRLVPARPGAGVRLLLTVRWTGSRPSTAAWRDALALPAGTALTDLDPLTAPDLEVLVRGARPDAGDDEVAAAAARLVERTDGDPVTVGLHLRDLTEDGVDLASWRSTLAAAPRGLAGFFDAWWHDQVEAWQPTGRADDAERVLGLLVVAHGPLHRDDLAVLSTRIVERIDGVRLRKALEALARLTLPGPGDGTVVVAHPAITEMLRERRGRENDEYRAALVDWGLEVLDAVVAGELGPREVPDYLVAHLAQHLTEGPAFVPRSLGLTGPAWRRVHDATATSVDAHRRDIDAVADHARRLDAARGGPPRHLPERVLCAAAAAADRRATGREVTPELAHAFVRHRLWRPERGIAHADAQLHERTGNRCLAVERFAPDVPVAAFDLFSRFVDTALAATPYPEIRARAAAAWARRLLDEGFVAEALAVPDRLAPDDGGQGFVRAWVVADLAGHLPDDVLAPALAAALAAHRPGPGGGGSPYALGRLVRSIPLPRAATMWPLVAPLLPSTVRERADAMLANAGGDGDGDRVGAVLLAALGADPDDPVPTVVVESEDGTLHLRQAFVAAAPWIDGDWVEPILVRAVGDDDTHGVLPNVNFDGALAAATVRSAPALFEIVHDRWTGTARLGGLAQLLPLLDGDLRARAADAFFVAPAADLAALGDDANRVYPVVPALVAAGCVDRLLAAIAPLRRRTGWMDLLVDHLDLDQIDVAFQVLQGDWMHARLLARRAVLDLPAAGRALERARGAEAESWLRDDIVRHLRHRVADLPAPLRRVPPVVRAWWRDTYLSSWSEGAPVGIPLHGRGRSPAVLAAFLDAVDDGTTADDLVDLAADLAGSRDPGPVDAALDAASRLDDAWTGLALLAGATHRAAGEGLDAVHDAIRTRVARVRAPAETLRASLLEYGDPAAEAPWLATDHSSWAPVVARLAAPGSRPLLRELLLDGGCVPWMSGPAEGRDRCATVLLAMTPLFDRDDLAVFDAFVDRTGSAGGIDSGTLRPYGYAGAAAGWAALGDLPHAFRAAEWATDHAGSLRGGVLADVLRHVPPERVPDWIAQVHRLVPVAQERGNLWSIVEGLLPALDDADAARALDGWLAGIGTPSRIDVLRDAVFYLALLERSAGHEECTRLIELVADPPG